MSNFVLPSIDEYPTQQATASKTFRPPPLDGSLTILGMFDWHLEHSSTHPLFRYQSPHTNQINTVLWSDAVKAIHRSARFVQKSIADASDNIPQDNANPPVVAILGNIDTIRYFTLNMGIIRAGYVAFPISPRNSALGVANLLVKTKCVYMFVSEDLAMKTLAEKALEILRSDPELSKHPKVHKLTLPNFDYLYPEEDNTFEPLPLFQCSIDTPAFILHSSGSTGFPKPITFTHKVLVQWTLLPWHGEVDVCGEVFAAHSIPMFHGLGLIIFTWAFSCGLIVSCFAPATPPILPASNTVLSEAVETKSTYMFCVPAWLEGWAREEALIPTLANFKGIMFSGAPLNKIIGDLLHARGVHFMVLYGCTETGSLVRMLPTRETHGKDWDYFQLSPQANVCMRPRQDLSDSAFEPVLIDSLKQSPNAVNEVVEGRSAYASNDLLVQHPTRPDLWKVYGRADDQIMLSTGEKTNPVPIEGIFMRDPQNRINNAVMFGRGRFSNGIILELKESVAFEPSDSKRLADFRNEIWSLVEEANQFAPAHSRLFKEMILVAKKVKPFEYTPKGTARRHAVIAMYQEEIEEAYANVEYAASLENHPPTEWTREENLTFLRGIVKDVLKKPVQDADDLFEMGCDSLQATWLRNKILKALRETAESAARSIPQNLLYTHSNIIKLADYLTGLGHSNFIAMNPTSKLAGLTSMVEEFTRDLPIHVPSLPNPEEEVVLLTGSTGSLGCHILDKLLKSPTVIKIYALNRRSSSTSDCLRKRQAAALLDRGLDVSSLDSGKVVLVECDYTEKNLGLSEERYEEIRQTVTVMIHNAWILDFNRVLASFRPMISSVRFLVDLALSSPFEVSPTIVFTSSIGVTLGLKAESKIPEAPIEDASVLVSLNGYGQSKWVSERILEEAYQTRLLRTVNVRVGQVTGGINGSWNTFEWFPSLVKSGSILGCLPGGEDIISWTPVDIAAAAIVDFRKATEQTVHLNHPKPVKWSSIMNHLAEQLKVPTVEYAEWLKKLEEWGKIHGSGEQALLDNPALKLMDFYRSCAVTDGRNESCEALGFPTLAIQEALEASPSLANAELPSLGKADADKWLLYWKSKSYITY